MMPANSNGSSPKNSKNWLEWSTFGLSLGIIVAVVGVLGSQAIQEQGTPAAFEVELAKPIVESPWMRVPITVRNFGDKTAQMVVVEVTMSENGENLAATCTFDFVPAHGTQHGVVLFPEKNVRATLTANVVGFTER